MEKINEVLNNYGICSKKPLGKEIETKVRRALLLYRVTPPDKRVVQTVDQRNSQIENWLVSEVINRAKGLYIEEKCRYFPVYQFVNDTNKAALRMIIDSFELRYDQENEKLFFQSVISYKLIDKLSEAREICIPIIGGIIPSLILRASFTEEDRIGLLFQEEVSKYLVGILHKTAFLYEFKRSVIGTFAVKDKQTNK
ncbi:hypothetical protein [Bacillus sp. Brlt_9]|uniref:hypothetical protein n=1 Tax=Bacillus sp. Brlt_9 TaxID=3110916 RepID=UPI003F7C0773